MLMGCLYSLPRMLLCLVRRYRGWWWYVYKLIGVGFCALLVPDRMGTCQRLRVWSGWPVRLSTLFSYVGQTVTELLQNYLNPKFSTADTWWVDRQQTLQNHEKDFFNVICYALTFPDFGWPFFSLFSAFGLPFPENVDYFPKRLTFEVRTAPSIELAAMPYAVCLLGDKQERLLGD